MNAFRGGARLSDEARKELGFRGGKLGGPSHPHRRAMLAKAHLAKKELGLVEDDYREILLDETGRDSSGKCTDAELVKLLDRFKRQGFQAKKAGPKPADHPGAGKARALWISLGQLGAIDNPSEQALEAFARRQLKCERLQWADQSLTFRLIEALKAIAERHGWNQSLDRVIPAEAVGVLKRRLIDAQMVKLARADWVPADWDARRAAYSFAGVEIASIRTAALSELDQVAQVLGRAISDARKTGKLK